MITDDDAEELFGELVALLEEDQWQDRFRQVLADVRAAIARGKPARAEIAVAGKRKREVVRRVEALTAGEQLEILVSALEFALVTPVDLAHAAMQALSTEEVPVDALAFERDTAGGEPTDQAGTDVERRTQPASTSDNVVVRSVDITGAVSQIEPLRDAIHAIKRELAE